MRTAAGNRSKSESGDDGDVLEADPPDHGRAQLLVTTTEHVALAADDADHEPRGAAVEQLEQLRLVQV